MRRTAPAHQKVESKKEPFPIQKWQSLSEAIIKQAETTVETIPLSP